MIIADVPVRPRWPTQPFDPARANLLYSPLADELVLYFSDRNSPHYVDFIDAPGFGDAAVLIGVDEDDEETGEIVGVQVDLLVSHASRRRPAWRALAEPTPSPEEVAGLVVDIGALLARYWKPPVEE